MAQPHPTGQTARETVLGAAQRHSEHRDAIAANVAEAHDAHRGEQEGEAKGNFYGETEDADNG